MRSGGSGQRPSTATRQVSENPFVPSGHFPQRGKAASAAIGPTYFFNKSRISVNNTTSAAGAGGAASSFFRILFAAFTIRKMTNETSRKLMTEFKKLP